MFYNITWEVTQKHLGTTGDEQLSKIRAVTNDNRLIITARPIITSGSRNIDELSVVFDKSWVFDSAFYYVNFFIDDDEEGIIRRFNISGNVGRCTIPDYITAHDGFFHFGVFAKAGSDIVKTSDIAAYEIEKGICIAPDGDEHDTVYGLKRRFIDLLNANMNSSNIPYNVRFEDIDAIFTTYMSELYGGQGSFSVLCDAFYNLVKENVNPNFERYSEDSMVLTSCFAELENYFENGSFGYDSADSQDEETVLFKSEILGLVNEYIDPDFNVQADTSQLLTALEDFLSLAKEHEEERQNMISDLYLLYTEEEEEANV